jgi:hypothetical protein
MILPDRTRGVCWRGVACAEGPLLLLMLLLLLLMLERVVV